MISRVLCLPSLLGATIFFSSMEAVHSAIVISIQPGTFQQNSGVQSLGIVARSTSSDLVTAFATDIRLAAGIFDTPPGTFMQSGQIGTGSTGASSFTRSSNTLASLSLEFNIPSNPPTNAQLFPLTDGLLATIRVNVNGLNPGNYGITFENSNVLNAAGNLVSTTANAGSFTITPVPEPSSALLVLAGIVGIARGRKLIKMHR